jgi:pimeloyl-ACP methyl ester carboxylesterase
VSGDDSPRGLASLGAIAQRAILPGTSVRYVVIPGAGSAGLAWQDAAARLGAPILPVPDAPDVPAMAAELARHVATVPRPRVLVGTSLGAMVALELARRVEVDGLALVAAGFGIAVADSVLEWVEANPPDLLDKMARSGLADRDDARVIAIRLEDFRRRGQPVLLGHLTALGAYRPEPLEHPPPTVVIRGERDRAVPLADHEELALRCGGELVVIPAAGHAPFLEQPDRVVAAIRALAVGAAASR